jgi:uncharacterized protein YbjT (DUF2867 family)
MDEVRLAVKGLDAVLTSLRKIEMWKSANHLDDNGRQKRTLKASGPRSTVVQESLFFFGIGS